MDSRQSLTVIGLSLVLSIMLVPSFEQAFAPHEKCFESKKSINEKFAECNLIQPKIPHIGTLYVVNVFGAGFIPTGNIIKLASAQLELNVTSVKTTNIKAVYLTLIKGNLTVGHDTYSLSTGSVTVIAGYVNIKASSEDGMKILTVYATLVQSLPIAKSDKPVGLLHARAENSADIVIIADHWFLNNFKGNIGRMA